MTIKNKKHIYAIIASIFLAITGMSIVFQTVNITKIQKGNALYGNINWDGQDFEINSGIYNVENEENLGCTGIDIVTTAMQLLGKTYGWDDKGATSYNNGTALDASEFKSVDCSGLVWWTLKTIKQSGKDIGNINADSDNPSDIPLNTYNWLKDGNSYYTDAGYFKRDPVSGSDTLGPWYFVTRATNGGKSSEEAYKNKKVNILKRNDPITTDYRWYNYINKDGNVDELPVGTVVISEARLVDTNKTGHAWIALGNLGTNTKEGAITAIKEKFGVDVDEKYVCEPRSSSNYWRIESEGGSGVIIDNGDPNMSEDIVVDGRVKGTGPVWAFQIGSDEKQPEGSYHIYIGKRDADDKDEAVADALFNIKKYKDETTSAHPSDEGLDVKTVTSGDTYAQTNQCTVVQIGEKDGTLQGKTISNWQNEITDATKFDKYEIYEKDAPSGYKKSNNKLIVEVHKTQSGRKYVIEKLKLSIVDEAGNASEQTEITIPNSGNADIYLDSKGSVVADANGNWQVRVEANGGAFAIYWTDEQLEGNYRLNIVKKSSSEYEGITDKSQVDLSNKKTGIGGATFVLTQQVRNEDGSLSDPVSKTVNTLAGMQSSSVFGNTQIHENGVGPDKYDRYTIDETNVPNGFLSVDLKGITFDVYKILDGTTYKVDYVRINDANGTEIGRATRGTGTTAKDVLDLDKNGTWDLGIEVNSIGTSISITVINEHVTGSFNINLVKFLKGTATTLPGAEFNIKVQKVENSTVVENPIYQDKFTTDSNGSIITKELPIGGENETYKITAEETTPPAGYIGISGPITFDVKTKKDGNTYKLVAQSNMTVKNAKKVDVKENEILIEAENRTTEIDIHKGVKTVENQDSGYFYKDTRVFAYGDETTEHGQNTGKGTGENQEIVDETTGKAYTEIELKEIYHDWVVETTIPEGVSKYNKYLITDPIDLSKLEFSGLGMVVVERIDKAGNVIEKLTKDKDYKVTYEEDKEKQKGNLTVTYINKKDGNNFIGAFLTEAGVKSRPGIENTKIRVTFNTTFKVNKDGKLAVLDGKVTNAENKSKLIYDNGNGKEEEKESEQPEVHTGAVSVFKYEDTNGNMKHDEGEKALVGAVFKIALTEQDAKDGKFIKIDGQELVAVTNEHGIATFVGLSFGGDAKDDQKNLKDGLYSYDWEKASRDYYIVETETPAGYEKLEDVIKVTVSKHSSEIIELTDKINEMESVGNRPLKFDLALRKWVTQAIVTENGQTVVYETGHKAEDDPEDVVKVDLKKSKINEVIVKFKYSIRVKNEGEIAGEAQEITDYIPEGLKFVKEDNPDWETTDDPRIVKTDKLKGVTLEPGEMAGVEIMLTWVNSEKSMGVMTNTAEISKDYNKYGVPDIDSVPNNRKPKEDDIDDAPVMLTIKTGSEIIAYATLGLSFVAIISVGIIAIKGKFQEM